MKRPKISRRAETRPYGRVSAPTGNCRKFLTQLAWCTDSAGRGSGGCWPGTDGHAGGGCAGGDGADLPARASAGSGAGSDDGSGAQVSAVASGAEEVGRGEGSASGSGGLFGSTGRPRSVDREAAGGRAGATT